ncbi:conjugal transfer protein TraF [uncultured Clostridium sp.]|jgi:predicted bacteriocin transport accessory protein|uniref:conjugal transfer protein TraF n=1 Tax=uncultured Clostridium sp. TaxID=59620 RepID=UPI00260E7D55|nr:conjugal transfer protein TraF [uncultured Clostridium sp.]
MFGTNTFEKDIELLTEVLSEKADILLTNEESAVVFIGRGSCPYCRKFAKTLNKVVKDINSTVYFVNSENFSDKGISSFREKYSIPTVPGFIVKKNREIEVRCDSSLSEETIITLAN